ncbi:transcription termination factor Rho, partial [Mesotoga sp. SC_NapDC]
MSPRKKKTEETPNEQVEKVPIEKAANKRTTKRKAESKKTESKKTESKKNETKRDVENQKANITPSNESGKEKEEVMTISKKNYEEPNADGPVAQETFREGVMDDAKEIPKKDKDKDKDNIREVEIDISQLQAMPIREVYKLARKYDVQGYTQMAKKDLIFAVLKAQTESYGYFFDQGVLEITDGGYGFLRTLDNNLLPSSNDIYVSQSQIRRFNLTSGDTVAGQVRPPKEGEKYFALLRIEAINHKAINFAAERITFQNLTPI